jgi:hypothetical protein
MSGIITGDAIPVAGWAGTWPWGQSGGVEQSSLPPKERFSFWANCSGHA